MWTPSPPLFSLLDPRRWSGSRCSGVVVTASTRRRLDTEEICSLDPDLRRFSYWLRRLLEDGGLGLRWGLLEAVEASGCRCAVLTNRRTCSEPEKPPGSVCNFIDPVLSHFLFRFFILESFAVAFLGCFTSMATRGPLPVEVAPLFGSCFLGAPV